MSRKIKKNRLGRMKLKLIFLRLYFSLCLWIYKHSQCICDIAWLDNKDGIDVNQWEKVKENKSK
jgi:hypothetical protein